MPLAQETVTPVVATSETAVATAAANGWATKIGASPSARKGSAGASARAPGETPPYGSAKPHTASVKSPATVAASTASARQSRRQSSTSPSAAPTTTGET